MFRTMLADPGTGDPSAPKGSEPWAQHIRLKLRLVINNLSNKPDMAAMYFDILKEHSAWHLMNRRDGSYFETLEEFCSYDQPWGLGTPYREIKPFIVAVRGENATKLMETPGDRRERDAAYIRADASGHDVPMRPAGNTKAEKRSRAVLRSPAEIRTLFEAGMISQKWAAKLGPYRATPEQAARIAEIVKAVRGLKDRKRIDATVRDMLGEPVLSLLDRTKRMVGRLSHMERAELVSWLQTL